MTTDNRTNEQLSGNTGQFTEAQVEAAARALDPIAWGRYDLLAYAKNPWPSRDLIVEHSLSRARAALVAAQGVAPVLPSSGVDEEKLAEVIESHVLGDPNGGTASWAWLNCSCGHRIEIAGVTREYVVALGRKHQARAVAEWLEGQGR